MAVDKTLAFATIGELGAGLRAGTFTAVELAEFFLERLARLGREYNCVVTVTRTRALEQARRADREFGDGKVRGPLHGIPFGVKDLIAAKGYPTSWGAAPFKDRVIDTDATVVTRLERAGAVLAAKLSMVTFAGGFGYSSANCTFSGPQYNPWDKRRFAGGSSSGPGAAVGGGMVPIAIGSETSGSIISPAHYCGISGLRPTYGRVSRYGAMALSWTLDKLGPLCRSADDCGLVLAALAGPDENDRSAATRDYTYPPTDPPKPPFKLAMIKGCADKVQPEVQANFNESLAVLGGFSTIDEIELPDLPFGTVIDTILSCEKAAAFEPVLKAGHFRQLTDPRTRQGAPYADLLIPARDYLNAMRLRGEMQRAIDELMAQYDAVLTPTLGIVAYPSDRNFSDYAGAKGIQHINMGSAANVVGLPGISIPNGFGEDHLPTGLNLIGRAFEENRLLAIANRYQNTTDWHRQHPQL